MPVPSTRHCLACLCLAREFGMRLKRRAHRRAIPSRHLIPSGVRTCEHGGVYGIACAGNTICDVCFQKRVKMQVTGLVFKHSHLQATDRDVVVQRSPSIAADDDDLNEDMSFQETANAASEDASSIEPLQFAIRYADKETPPLVFLHKASRKIVTPPELGRPGHVFPVLPSPDRLVLASGDLLSAPECHTASVT